MDFSGNPTNNQIINNIFSGFYSQTITNNGKPRLYEFSSPNFPITNFTAPYDAILHRKSGDFNNSIIIAAGRQIDPKTETVSSNRSGVLYSNDNAIIYGVCHGFGRDDLMYYNGYNFYNAPYSPGYFTPPFGENLSILQGTQGDGYNVLYDSCATINITEYNEYFGINSIFEGGASSDTYTNGQIVIVSSPKVSCPEQSAAFYLEEDYHLIQGTSQALGASTFYNSNPIPTSLDNYEIRITNGRYAITVTQDGEGNSINNITYKDGRAKPSYGPNSQQNKLNNSLCLAEILETQVGFGIGTNGIQLLIAPDVDVGSIGSQASFIGVDDPWNLWHFQFKENSDTFPFYNNYTSNDDDTSINNIQNDEGETQLFDSILAIEDNYWQNRQCPNVVDYLPYTFGASIYACPSYYFDVPYYAATKKFGFLGMRFLNACSTLQLNSTLSGVKNATELPMEPDGLFSIEDDIEPEDLDSYGAGSFAQYDNLLSIASAEESYCNVYALNKGFFLWANNYYIQQSSQYQNLVSTYPKFLGLYSGMILPFQNIFGTGINGIQKYQPSITYTGGNIINTSIISDILLTNDEYLNFKKGIDNIFNNQDMNSWNQIENSYSFYISNGTTINEDFYKYMVTGAQSRLLTRYLQNTVQGNPIDLFPLNQISFSTDNAKDYLESNEWARSTSSFGLNSPIPSIQRRYFAGAYGNEGAISGLIQILNKLSIPSNSYYYPGSFNEDIGKDNNSNTYYPVYSGIILDNKGRSFSTSGWLTLGYNEIGKLDGNFSCFTPIFLQNPVPEVFCKIGQAPTFRAYAVDYHSIPDDKITPRYPEIVYWAQKLKMLDTNSKYLYPLSYKWYRVPQNSYSNFLKYGDFSLCTESNVTGDWCCLEGDTNNCTLIHPNLCRPTGQLGSQSSYNFMKGAIQGGNNGDDQYNYFCLASGRFGIRISEPSSLIIENWVQFDVSFKNGMSVGGELSINFNIVDELGSTQTIEFPSSNNSPYNGYMRDEYAIPESQILQKIPPPNAGYGDVTAFEFVGPIKYIGALRSYSPSTVQDTRGLTEAWGRMLDYGSLVKFYKQLSQSEGDALYGYSHLPICSDYELSNGQYGIQIIPTLNGNQITHWTLEQRAVASYDFVYFGVPWNELSNFGALYPPITTKDEDYDTMGVGHWQWYNNLGAIKRFGYLSTYNTNDIVFIGNGSPSANDSVNVNAQIALIKKQWIKPDSLAGSNCGYTEYGLGRNMIFYIEAFDSFYSYCDPLKKKNIQNVTYMNPGIRQGNSAIQYFWLGRPNNTYLERKSMYGPYAYQWKVNRHNRDRNGNGISQSFYSMGYSEPYSLVYDAPAIYGLYTKTTNSPSYIEQVTNIVQQRTIAGFSNDFSVRGNWFGTTNGEGSASAYGNIMVNCDTDNALCDYFSSAQFFAGSQNMSDYSCTQDKILKGECFDPCISIRYGQGFFPGGKAANLFGTNSPKISNRLVPMANNINNEIIQSDEQSKLDHSVYFRSPVNTPYSQIMKNYGKIVGISPCQDGGSDHCNYVTPTIHVGTSSFIQGLTSSFLWQVNAIESLIGNNN
jgi:hypothetical protein